MTKDQHRRMLAAAQDIVHHADDPAVPLDPLTVQWARDMLALQPRRPCPAPIRDQMLALWDADLLAGFTPVQLAEQTDRPVKKVRELCVYLAKEGRLFQLGGGVGNRFTRGRATYFVSDLAREQARPAFEAETARTQKPPKVPRVPKAERPPKIPRLATTRKPRVNLARKETTPFNPTDGAKRAPRPRAPSAPSGEAVNPHNIQPTICPGYQDRRYEVALPAEGFVSEWQRLRGQA